MMNDERKMAFMSMGFDAVIERCAMLEDHIAELERTIIEAGAEYNIDKKPGTIESATLGLVTLCDMGREAMDKVAELEAGLRSMTLDRDEAYNNIHDIDNVRLEQKSLIAKLEAKIEGLVSLLGEDILTPGADE
jgi:hypothetical protein